MNKFDQFVKHTLKIKYYIRYADDFVILSRDRNYLEQLFPIVFKHLDDRLQLSTHPTKCSIKTFASGVGFLGWVHFPDHRVLRTSTKRRMLRNLEARRLSEREGEVKSEGTLSSYLGMLSHGDAYKIQTTLLS